MEQTPQPERAQRSRVKGYKMVHENGLPNYYVGRPGVFGNPLKLIGDCIYIDASHRRTLMDPWLFLMVGNAWVLQDLFRHMLTDTMDLWKYKLDEKSMYDVNIWIKKMSELNLNELKGQNLYCYCPICNEDGTRFPCHADVLLELANK